MPGQHSRLSPSSAHRWLRCPGAPNAEHGLSDRAGAYAAEGTAFHEIAACCLDYGLEPEDFIGSEVESDGFVFIFTDEMAKHMRPGLAWVREHSAGAKLYVETRVDLSVYLGPGEGGTADVGIVDVANRKIIIFDWKYGQGIPVSPVENEQEMLYGLGFWHTVAAPLFDNDPAGIVVELVIEQPRAPGGGGVWLTTMEHLLSWGAEAALYAVATHDPNAPRIAGETQCTFCRAKGSPEGCDAYNQFQLDLIGVSFEEMDEGVSPPLPRPGTLTPERRSYIVLHRPMIEKWLKEVHAYVMDDALKGESTPGLKLVYGRRGGRTYADGAEAKIAEILVGELGESGAYVRELISPAAAQKKLTPEGYEKLKAYVILGEPKRVLAAEDDEREALPAYADQFSDEDLI